MGSLIQEYDHYDADWPSPVFVTWKNGKTLRGCIGCFSAAPLAFQLREYSLLSGLHDKRFPPITREELPQLNVVVSFLRDFTPRSSVVDFEIGPPDHSGRHGVILVFEGLRGERSSSTYLPEVPKLNNWDHEDTLRHLLKKAKVRMGWEEAKPFVRLTTYTTSRATMTFDEWKAASRDPANLAILG